MLRVVQHSVEIPAGGIGLDLQPVRRGRGGLRHFLHQKNGFRLVRGAPALQKKIGDKQRGQGKEQDNGGDGEQERTPGMGYGFFTTGLPAHLTRHLPSDSAHIPARWLQNNSIPRKSQFPIGAEERISHSLLVPILRMW